MIAVLEEYNVKCHYTTKHCSLFDEILGLVRVDKMEYIKNPLRNNKTFLPNTRKIQNWLQNRVLCYMSLWQKAFPRCRIHQ